jgi:hypothetical protein
VKTEETWKTSPKEVSELVWVMVKKSLRFFKVNQTNNGEVQHNNWLVIVRNLRSALIRLSQDKCRLFK